MEKISKKKLVIGIVLAVFVVLGVSYFIQHRAKNEVKYRNVAVKRGDLSITILATGTVSPENRLEIKAPVAGRMDRVLVTEGQKLRKGQIIAWMSSSERAAMLDAARSKGEEEYQRWSEMYLPTPVLAPISGTLILRSVEPGQTFTSSDAIFTMSDRLAVKGQVDETDISKIKLKQQARIILDAYPTRPIEAQVDQIAFDSKTVNSVTTYIVDILPMKVQEFMLSGMTANVTFYVESKKDVLLIPTEAMKVEDGKTIVTVKDASGKPLKQVIEIGSSDGKSTEVVKGLVDGQEILIPEIKLGGDKKGSNPFSPMGGMPRGSRK